MADNNSENVFPTSGDGQEWRGSAPEAKSTGGLLGAIKRLFGMEEKPEQAAPTRPSATTRAASAAVGAAMAAGAMTAPLPEQPTPEARPLSNVTRAVSANQTPSTYDFFPEADVKVTPAAERPEGSNDYALVDVRTPQPASAAQQEPLMPVPTQVQTFAEAQQTQQAPRQPVSLNRSASFAQRMTEWQATSNHANLFAQRERQSPLARAFDHATRGVRAFGVGMESNPNLTQVIPSGTTRNFFSQIRSRF